MPNAHFLSHSFIFKYLCAILKGLNKRATPLIEVITHTGIKLSGYFYSDDLRLIVF
jgi:hypothetical protein